MMARKFETFREDDSVIIFASGVSNSKETDPTAFERERQLLQTTITRALPHQQLIYFSTTSVYDSSVSDSSYVRHKIDMEALIAAQCQCYCIFRVSNVVGINGNSNTIFNYFSNAIANEIEFELWQFSERNLIDIDDVGNLVHYFMVQPEYLNTVVNLAFPVNFSVFEIVNAIADLYNKNPHVVLVPKGASYKIEPLPDHLIKYFSLSSELYLSNLVRKYLPTA